MGNRPKHTSKRLIGLVSIACAAVVFSAAPAGAVIASPRSSSVQPSLYVLVANNWKVQFNTICGRHFSYVQRMTLGGVSAMVPTEYLYPTGRHALVLEDTCDGYHIYSLADGTPGPP